MKKKETEEEESADDPPFIVAATVGMTSSSSSSAGSGKNNNSNNKVELIARRSMPTFVLKMLLCKAAGLNESDYDVRYKGKIIPVLDPNVTLKECGIAKETLSGVSLWENETCRRRKVADELDAYRREKREQFYDEKKKKKNGEEEEEEEDDPRAEARREIERIKARNSYSPDSNHPTTTTTTVERQDTSRYGHGTSSTSSQRQPFSSSTANENPAYYYPRPDQYHREQQYHHHHHQQQQPYQSESPIVIDDRDDDDDDDRRDGIYTNSAERRQSHGNDYRQNNYHRQPPPAPPEELDDLAKRRIASDQLQKIIADVDAIKFRVDDILDVHKNDPSLISDALRKTTLKNAREAAHLLEKSLLQADAVESYGFADIRAMRKGLVARVENMCGKLEPLTKESE